MIEQEQEQPEHSDTPEQTPELEPDEAEEAEQEEQPEQPDTEPEQPEQPEQRSMSEKEIEKAFKRLETANAAHARKVGEIMGEDAQDLQPCPLCAHFVAGHVFPVAQPPELVANVSRFLGLPDPEEYQSAPDARKCDKCDGRGRVLTGSLVPEHRDKPCRTCAGTGWIGVGGPAENGTHTQPGVHPAFTQEPTPLPEDDPTIAALKKRGYVVVPPPMPINAG